MLSLKVFGVAFSLLLVVCGGADVVSPDVVVKNAERTIDLASQLVKVSSKMSIENAGKGPLKALLFAVQTPDAKHISHIAASLISSGSDSRKSLSITPTTVDARKGQPFWRIELRHALEAGKTVQVEVETVFSHLLTPYPSQITQAEQQYIMYSGNAYLYSPYVVAKQTTSVTLPSSTIESYTKLKPVTQSDNTVSYGPYENVAPFTSSEMVVHYENNSPFLTVTSHERAIEVSHWGNVAVEESVDLLHTGATLKGPFSRYEYQRDQNGASSIKSFKTVLPAAAMDIYYRDEIGNISTSHLRVLDDAVEADLRPRFPLFGGWKTHYIIGYNLPSYEYLFNQGSDYVLKMRFVDHIYDDMIIEESTVKIILPEGTKDIKLKTPYEVNRHEDSLHYTYLDTTGRPVVIASKKNLVENHIQEFELHYTYQKMLMFQEPLLVIIAFYLLFLLVIIYVRLDFSISKDEASESKMKVASMSDQVHQHHEKRNQIYQQLENAINQFKSTKDNAAFQSAQKRLNAEHKNANAQVTEVINKLKLEAADIAEKVGEVQKLDRQMKDQIGQQISNAEKLVSGKMKKDQYIDNEQMINKKKEELTKKMENILCSL